MSGIVLTIGVKALNEEEKIAACLAGAVEAAAPFGGEVVLADSGSADRTVEIARGFPVRIVQFADPSERCCGAAAQLAFQAARGRYFYLLDGDMVVQPGFLEKAIARLEAEPRLAGVGGQMRERNISNIEFAMRTERLVGHPDWVAGPVSRLEGGGVYRAEAIRDAGYFADRNLHAFEEFDLAARLTAKGWRLERIEEVAMEHHGHSMGGYSLLWRRFCSGYAGAPGEMLRAAMGKAHWPLVLRHGHVRHGIIVILWWLALLAMLLARAPWWAFAVIVAAPLLFLRRRQSDWPRTFYTFVMWNLVAVGAIPAFFRRRRHPEGTIAAVDLSGPGGTTAAMPAENRR